MSRSSSSLNKLRAPDGRHKSPPCSLLIVNARQRLKGGNALRRIFIQVLPRLVQGGTSNNINPRMTDLNKVGKRALTLTVVALTILWTVAAGLAPLATSAQVSLSAGNLVRGTSFRWYYYGTDDGATPSPTKTYMTWYLIFQCRYGRF